jgi:hypothetical protein
MGDVFYLGYNGVQHPVRLRDLLEMNSDRYFTTYYHSNSDSLLNHLCDKYGSDKGTLVNSGHCYPWPSHSYADFIERLFGHCRNHVKAVFECGLGTNNPALLSSMGVNGKPGASLRMWRDYFPAAEIVGADIDRAIMFQEDRISTYYCDQTDKNSISALWEICHIEKFDIMIDDGLHTFEAGKSLLQHSFHMLKDGGIYIIEDVSVESIIKYIKFLKNGIFRYEIVNLYRKGLTLGDNSLIVIRK